MTDNTPLPAPGWYPAPHASGEQRYWDGAQWTDWTPESAAAARQSAPADATATASQSTAPATAVLDPAAPVKKKGLKWWAWFLIALGALILLIIIIGSINGGRGSTDDAQPAAGNGGFTQESKRPTAESTREVPQLVGLTVAEAKTKLAVLGITLVDSEIGDDWTVTSQSLPGGSDATEQELATLSISAEAPKPVFTLGQENAIESAKSYLSYSAFSRAGLFQQLTSEYGEGFPAEDAEFAIAYLEQNGLVDWNAEAAESAKSYLDYSSFSRDGLYEQLTSEYGEEFTPDQANYALSQVGY